MGTPSFDLRTEPHVGNANYAKELHDYYGPKPHDVARFEIRKLDRRSRMRTVF